MKSKLYLFFFFIASQYLFAQSPVTRLTDTYCFNYNLPTINSNFFAIKKGGIGGYIFDVENQTTFQTDSLITFGRVAGRFANLSSFPLAGITYGTTYKVTVRTWTTVSTNYSTPSGVDCFVITPVQSTQIRSSQCNSLLPDFATPVYADNIGGAEAFTFELTNQTTLAVEEFEKSSGTIRAFSMNDFPPSFADYSTTYTARVKVKVNGTYGAYGSSCEITTPTTPLSQLGDFCDSSIPVLNTALCPQTLGAATGYRYEVTDGTNTTVVTPDMVTSQCLVLIPVGWSTYSGTPSSISWVTYGMTLDVRVSAFIDGAWGAYGPLCQVTTPCGSKLEASEDGKIIDLVYYDPILAEGASCSVEDYQFRYRIGSASATYSTASGGNESIETPTDITLFMSDFGPISNFPGGNPYGKNYRISVRVKSGGVWGPFGIERVVTVNSNPTVNIRDGLFPAAGSSQCGTLGSPYNMASVSTILLAYNLYGFSTYTYEVTELDGGGGDIQTQTITRDKATYGSMARGLRINMLGASTPAGIDGTWANSFNTTFRVRVKTNLGNYGNPCFVRTPSAMALDNSSTLTQNVDDTPEESVLDLEELNLTDAVKFFPNPFSNSLNVRVSEEFEGINTIQLFDLSGKELVILKSSLADFINGNLIRELNNGVYVINIFNANGQRTQSRLVKLNQ
jgi:hypothetical protein